MQPKNLRMLFVGNSFTQRNNLPGLLSEIAAARKITIQSDLIAAGGASLRTHWNAGRAAQAIAAGDYDYVVLQEQSTLPIKNATRMAENVRLFDEAIRTAKSRTVLFMTWARQNAPESQQQITDAYEAIGREIKAIVVPAGRAWQSVLAESGHPALHDRDKSHPAPAGTYLTACVFLTVLFKATPVGIESGPVNVDSAERAALQAAAWNQFKPRR